MNLCYQFKSIAVFLLILDFQQIRTKGVAATCAIEVKGTDCTEIFAVDEFVTSGLYTIKPEKAPKPFAVFCEKRSDGGWTIIQRRSGKGIDGKPVNFQRLWADYERGFGHAGYEHWLGLNYIHALSQQKGKRCQLRVDMTNCKGDQGYAFYDTFKIGNKSELYRISLGNYVGNAGDAFRGQEHAENQDGHYFSTSDKDNDDCDLCISGGQAYRSCARDLYGSGWWFSNCGMADLNGDWHPKRDCEGWLSGVYWATWDYVNSLAFSELKIKCTLL